MKKIKIKIKNDTQYTLEEFWVNMYELFVKGGLMNKQDITKGKVWVF